MWIIVFSQPSLKKIEETHTEPVALKNGCLLNIKHKCLVVTINEWLDKDGTVSFTARLLNVPAFV